MASSDYHQKGIAVLVAFLVVSAAGMAAGPVTPPEAAAEEAAMAPLEVRVMSFNIRVATPLDFFGNGWGRRKDEVVDVIRRYRPDVVGLQEVLKRQLDGILEGLPEYRYIGVGRDDGLTGGEFSCILYRKDRLGLSDGNTFWLSTTPDEPGSKSWGMYKRICTWARLVDKETGRAFYLYNTHLDNASRNAREKGADIIMQRAAARRHDDPFIVTGDLNASEDSQVIRFLKGQTTLDPTVPPIPLVDSYRVIHPDDQRAGTTGGFHNGHGKTKIDYVLTDPRIKVEDAQIIRDHGRASDHYPVIATVLMDH